MLSPLKIKQILLFILFSNNGDSNNAILSTALTVGISNGLLLYMQSETCFVFSG